MKRYEIYNSLTVILLVLLIVYGIFRIKKWKGTASNKRLYLLTQFIPISLFLITTTLMNSNISEHSHVDYGRGIEFMEDFNRITWFSYIFLFLIGDLISRIVRNKVSE